MTKCCKHCGEEIQGRSDKLFCNPYCKSNFHYSQNKEEPDSMYKKIEKQLNKNRKLLQFYNQSGKATIRKEKLIEAGFNPRLMTHYWKNSKNEVYFFCFEMGFRELKEKNNEKYLLITHQDSYMGKIP